MTPETFVAKWKAVTTSERATAQSHFNDLCDLLKVPKPHDVDPNGEWYAFEKGATKTTGSEGWADVWKQNCFAWEYKGKHKDLDKAFVQLQQYAVALQNPPLLIVSDIERIRIVTNWTNTVSTKHELTLDDLLQPAKRRLLLDAFQGSESLKPTERRDQLTAKVADKFAKLALGLGEGGHEPLTVAHFINRLVFCMFAEDIGILPDRLFTKLVDRSLREPNLFPRHASELFKAMCTGGSFGLDQIAWFNGGLFDDSTALPLTLAQLRTVAEVAKNDWSAIDPSIFGTLFERGLDPAKRSQLGAHYTDPESIMRIIEPVVLRPLRQEWEATKAKIEEAKQLAKRKALLAAYLERLRSVKVLDPACGSGNFLYLALKSLKDLELVVLNDAEAMGLGRAFPELDVSCVTGIELSPFAAELARVTVWIGELQWQIEHGFDVQRDPILRALETIENRDALLSADGRRATWPAADFIIGNPPFIGDKKMREELGDEYTKKIRKVYRGEVPGGADFVCFWFAKAGDALRADRSKRVGLVSTNKIRKGKNSKVLRKTIEANRLFEAWSDQPWHDERGAAVRVSIVCFGRQDHVSTNGARLDGIAVVEIHPDLTARTEANEVDLGLAQILPSNRGHSFNGFCLAGNFSVSDDVARKWLTEPNPSGSPSSDVLRPIWNGQDLTDGWRGRWVIDFGAYMSEHDAALYCGPFEWVEQHVKPVRLGNKRKARVVHWWRHGEARPGLRTATQSLGRVLVTPETTKHRWFRWLSYEQAPDHALIAIVAEDDFTFGVLNSAIHVAWMLGTGNRLGVGNDPRYNHTRTFQTFPLPELPSDGPHFIAVAEAARELNQLRENWLNPPEWTMEETLMFPATVGGPWHRWIPNGDNLANGSVAEAHYVRRVARPGARAMVAARTLTKLYNERPAWLRHAHEKLDIAVAAAYGIDPHITEPDLLAFLLNLNLARSASQP